MADLLILALLTTATHMHMHMAAPCQETKSAISTPSPNGRSRLKGPRVLPRGPSQLLLGTLGRIGRGILGRRFGLRCGALLATVGHRHHRGAQNAVRHAVALLVHVVDGLVVLRCVLDTPHGLVLERIERLALRVDGLNALVCKHIEQLGMHRVNAIDELLKIVGKLLATGMVDCTLDIVNHRQQRSDELLGRALALGDALVGGAAAEVLPVGL